MLRGLLKSRHWPIGLDIGTGSIKMLQLQRSGRAVRVVASGQRCLGNAVPDSGPERRAAVAATIRQILEEGSFSGRRVTSSLSCNQLGIKNVRLDRMPENQVAEAVKWEAGERFNFNIGPDELRWINAGQVRQGSEMRDEIIMIAVAAETIEEHLALLEEAGVIPEHIEAEPVALFRVFQHFLRRRDDEQAVSVVVDIGKSATRVTVARGPKIVFIKQIDIGGAKLTEGVSRQLNLSYEEAQDLRLRVMKDQGRPPDEAGRQDAAETPQPRSSVDWTIHDAMRSQVEELAKEVALCLRYCSVTFRGLHPNSVVLTGGEAYDKALVDLLAENLGVSCVVGRPLRGVDVSCMEATANRRTAMAEWAVCTGLALREMYCQEMAGEKEYAEHRLPA
ncbi:MAG: pilus assembly protein PilM [Planctomycetota bacterium]|jgi:type IV pilus assembly protein PilM